MPTSREPIVSVTPRFGGWQAYLSADSPFGDSQMPAGVLTWVTRIVELSKGEHWQ
jgi:hypothetical protein